MKKIIIHIVGTLFIWLTGISVSASAEQAIDRTVLPIQEPKTHIYAELDVKNTKPSLRFEVKAPMALLLFREGDLADGH